MLDGNPQWEWEWEEPQAPAPDETDDSVWVTIHELNLAADGGSDAAHYLSWALRSLQGRALGPAAPRLPLHYRDEMLTELGRLTGTLGSLFPAAADYARALDAIGSAGRLVCRWAASDEERGTMDAKLNGQANNQVRWLRNACHNIVLEQTW